MNKSENRFQLTGGALFDGSGTLPFPGSVTISGGKIESVYKDAARISGCTIIDISGCTVLPGFVHAHAHPGYKQLGENDLRDYDLDWLDACLMAGITTVRDMGALNNSSLEEILNRRNELNASGRCPRIVSAGKFLAAPGGYGGAGPIAVSTEQEACSQVRRAQRAGADFIKTSLENGYSPDTALPRLSAGLLRAICSEARACGLRVAAHLSQCEPLRTLVEAGITDAGHVPYEPMDDTLIRLMVDRGVVMTPTLTLYQMISEKWGAPFLDCAIDNVRRFYKAGGMLAVGDDYIEPAGPWYGPGLPMGELTLLKQAGLGNRQILQALTANGALACGLAGELGLLRPGMAADITVVRGDPLTDLQCLNDVVFVAARGRIVKNRCL